MPNSAKISPPLQQIPRDIVSPGDYQRIFHHFVRHDIYEYIEGGVADDITLNNNRDAFDQIKLIPKVLANFEHASSQCDLAGQSFKYPILLAPVAYQKLVHPQGELATIEAANVINTGFISSTLASTTLEQMADKLTTNKWFQLYFQDAKENTLSLVKRAEQAGYTSLVVTIDAPVNGLRNRAQRANFTMPAGVEAVNLSQHTQLPPQTLNPDQSIILNGIMGDAPTWQDIAWLQTQTKLPIFLKGIINPNDAKKAAAMGLAGIVVSNHGGRTLDGLPATIEMLPLIRQQVGPDFTLLLDSGIRRGSDIFKAIALGADAVLIGRPQLHGLGVAGALGVAHILRLFVEEFELTMALMGCATLADITPDCLYNP
ncbi:MAG: alpha-hydroxy-acid oxidizing protein [Gammaproteobacteria bacterium]|nr:alpha-hydroxy-acid oxidizing protein [Gammaproteobacteria bacterium]